MSREISRFSAPAALTLVGAIAIGVRSRRVRGPFPDQVFPKTRLRIGQRSETAASHPVVDRALAPSQIELIDIAFATATAMPLRPHVKDALAGPGGRRGGVPRAGPAHAGARLHAADRELAPRRPLSRTTRSTAPRRGSAAGVEPLLEKRRKIADDLAKLESSQDWQRDRIRARSRARLARARSTRAGAALVRRRRHGLGGRDARRRGGPGSPIPRPPIEQLAAMDDVVAKGNLDQIRNGLDACVEIFGALLRGRRAARAGRGEDQERLEENPRRGRHRPVPAPREDGFGARRRDEGRGARRGGAEDPRRGEVAARGPHPTGGARRRSPVHGAGEQKAAPRNLDASSRPTPTSASGSSTSIAPASLRAVAEAYAAIGRRAARARDLPARARRGSRQSQLPSPGGGPRRDVACRWLAARIEPDPILCVRIRQIRGGLGDPW